MKLQHHTMRSLFTSIAALGLLLACSGEELGDGHTVGSGNDLQLEKHEVFTEAQCQVVVKKVQESGKYTEEAIVPICTEEMKSPKCEFFGEALSLASSHTDFDSKSFCNHIAEARFCSDRMDSILGSSAVADLSYGECLRAKPIKGEGYCAKFQKMLNFAVGNDDLDTMRACYMIEAYSGGESEAPTTTSATTPAVTTTMAQKAALTTTTVAPNIISNEKNQKEFGKKGETPASKEAKPPVGQAAIIVKPEPVEAVGEGKGKGIVPTATAAIVVKPEPAKKQAQAAQPVVVLQGHKVAKPSSNVSKVENSKVHTSKPAVETANKANATVAETPAKKITASIVTKVVPLHPLAGHVETGTPPVLSVVQKAKPNVTSATVEASQATARKSETKTAAVAVVKHSAAQVAKENATASAKSVAKAPARKSQTNTTTAAVVKHAAAPVSKQNATASAKSVAKAAPKKGSPALVRVTTKVQSKKLEVNSDHKKDVATKTDKKDPNYGGFLSAFVN